MEISDLTKILSLMQSAADERISKIEDSLKRERPNSNDTERLIQKKRKDLTITEKAKRDIVETNQWFLDNKKHFPKNDEVSNEISEFLQRIGPLGYYTLLEVARNNYPDSFPKTEQPHRTY